MSKQQSLTKTTEQMQSIFSWLTGNLTALYILIMLCIFPLYTHNKYFDILKSRFNFFWHGTLALCIIFLLLGVFYLFADLIYTHGTLRRAWLQSMKWSSLRKRLLPTDYAFTALILITALSTVFSEYPYESFWGNRGRYSGLLLWLMFYLAYMIITRFYRFRRWHMNAFLVTGLLVCLWGITDFFEMDIFGFLKGVSDQYRFIFYSSIGNANTYTNLTAMIFAASAVLFIYEKKPVSIVFYYIVMAASAFADIGGNSDNVILSAGIVFAVLPFVVWKNRQGLYRYFMILATFLSMMAVIGSAINAGIRTIAEWNPGMLLTLTQKGFIGVMAAAIWLLSLLILFAGRKKQTGISMASCADIPYRTLRRIWGGLFAAAVCVVLFILYDANHGGHPDLYQAYSSALIFNNEWGTGRGLNWSLALDFFTRKMDLLHQLFGHGPDTYFTITMDHYMSIMEKAGYGMFDSAHNEYLEYIMTIGILGAAAYIATVVTAVRKLLFNSGANAAVTACGCTVLAYATQAVINISIPITTPVYILLMSIGISLVKAEEMPEKIK